MNLKQLLLYSMCTFLCVSTPAYAADSNDDLSRFLGTTKLYMLQCNIVAYGVFASKESTSKIRDCIDKNRTQSKVDFKTINAKFSKKADLQKLLKDYYVAWTSALNGLDPFSDELKIDYNRRQGAAEQKVDEAYTRLAIEAGIE